MPRGKLIVIEGTDGSGKATQAQLLIEHLRRDGQRVETIAFPRYQTPTGIVVKAYLEGRFGPTDQIDARVASLLYAADRWAAKPIIEDWLEQGAWVIADRYVASNMGHQGGKIVDPEERADFFSWNYTLEHEKYGTPRPDLNVILHVPPETSQRMMRDQGRTLDEHEKDLTHLRNAERSYQQMARLDGFRLVECVRDDRLMSREEIHELVWQEVQAVLQRQAATA